MIVFVTFFGGGVLVIDLRHLVCCWTWIFFFETTLSALAPQSTNAFCHHDTAWHRFKSALTKLPVYYSFHLEPLLQIHFNTLLLP